MHAATLVCEKSPKFDLSQVKYNNLGGYCASGDCTGQPMELRYTKVSSVGGVSVDLVVTAESAYEPSNPTLNGVQQGSKSFGAISMLCGKEDVKDGQHGLVGTGTDFAFQFVNSATNEPVVMDVFALTVYDVDQGKRNKGRETVYACGATSILTSKNPPCELTHTQTGDCSSFSSTARGNAKDNPTDPENLSAIQLARTVAYGYTNVTQFTFRFEVSQCAKGTGRSVLFASHPSNLCGQISRSR